MVRELLEQLVEKFNEKSRTDEKFKKELEGLERSIQLHLEDGRSFHFFLKDTLVDSVHDGGLEVADITISTDEETFRGIVSRDIHPMRAYATKRIKFKASLPDMLTMRKFF